MRIIHNVVVAVALLAIVGCCDKAAAASETKLSINSVAEAGFLKLSADQQTQVLQSITAAQSKETDTVDNIDKWVNVGERVGKMMGGAAREIGVAANDFIKTDVGKMTALLVVWNYMGKDAVDVVVHVGGGLILIIVGLMWVYIIMRRSQRTIVVYDKTRSTWFGNARIESTTRDPLTDTQQICYTLSVGVILALSLISMLSAL